MAQEYVGIDLQRRRSVIYRMDQAGEKIDSVRVENEPMQFAKEVSAAPFGSDVIVEANYGWYWAADLLEEIGYRVHLANPHGNDWGHRRVKNDESRIGHEVLKNLGNELEHRDYRSRIVADFFAGLTLPEKPPPFSEQERSRLVTMADLGARCRSPVVRDHCKRDNVELVPEAESPRSAGWGAQPAGGRDARCACARRGAVAPSPPCGARGRPSRQAQRHRIPRGREG
jgi:hypothetical protein